MHWKNQTILITGGGTGIGRGLAEALQRQGNRIIIAGRRREMLEAALRANPGMQAETVDLQNAADSRAFAARLVERHPDLNVVINNAGIMRPENLAAQGPDLADSEAIVATNLLGPLRLTAALLPHLLKQAAAGKAAAIMNVTSGLAFLPLAMTPTYCATKAALHSYTLSLRYQLKGSGVDIYELVPPYVATDLMSGRGDPRGMPLADYIREVMQILSVDPTPAEICVERVKQFRFAAESGKFEAIFNGLNEGMAKNPETP